MTNPFLPEAEKERAEERAALAAELADCLYYILYDIRDPEYPDQTLEDLRVLDHIDVTPWRNKMIAQITIKPTAAYCQHVPTIAILIIKRIEEELLQQQKRHLIIVFRVINHNNADELNRRLNDKERVAAAMEAIQMAGRDASST